MRLRTRCERDSVATSLPIRGKLATQEVIVTVLKTGAWPWLIIAAALIVAGLVAIEGTAGSVTLACGFLALFGAGVRIVSRNDPTPQEERRVEGGILASDRSYR